MCLWLLVVLTACGHRAMAAALTTAVCSCATLKPATPAGENETHDAGAAGAIPGEAEAADAEAADEDQDGQVTTAAAAAGAAAAGAAAAAAAAQSPPPVAAAAAAATSLCYLPWMAWAACLDRMMQNVLPLAALQRQQRDVTPCTSRCTDELVLSRP
jgi:hypothetical protein